MPKAKKKKRKGGSFGYPRLFLCTLRVSSPLMELSTKHPILADAAKHLPKPIFTLWLKHRRKAADAWCPKWRDEKDKSSRISMLDQWACFGALLN